MGRIMIFMGGVIAEATIATIAFGCAGAGAALMTIGFVSNASGHPADEKGPAASIWLGPGNAGVRGWW